MSIYITLSIIISLIIVICLFRDKEVHTERLSQIETTVFAVLAFVVMAIAWPLIVVALLIVTVQDIFRKLDL